LLGAGLSATSGIPTFRGRDSFWRGYEPGVLSTSALFEEQPVLCWWFFAHRRHQALKAAPNSGHIALAELAKRCQSHDNQGREKRRFLAINQNIDRLCERAGHPESALVRIHGSLNEFICVDQACSYRLSAGVKNPLIPALKVPNDVDFGDENVPLPPCTEADLPHCPICGKLLRPAVVWFGEAIPEEITKRVDTFITPSTTSPDFGHATSAGSVDLVLVIGTGAQVWPAAGYVSLARKLGAKVAVFNLPAKDDYGDEAGWGVPDWYFAGDCALTLPLCLNLAERAGSD
jgi:NAD-dependent SIR2 family protein deacetylase